ncbi:lipopolysaccharide biosynthesis protein [Novosphingobium huizhouense]|uniref:lipopolysaccharide biosynthesis protein n=1 Tax=Novosphingobium huizhouense TaxID=2866625 RepID=UPI001CD8579B|nr:oligosaccharide flippase family protein [Novosphingobium huizhouense]
MADAAALPSSRTAEQRDAEQQDIAALAKGGRTNFFGFLLRLGGTAPFLFIAGRFYGVEALGRYASALVIVELVSQVCSLGQRRGLAQRLAEDAREETHSVADAMTLSLVVSLLAAGALYAFPAPMFPSGEFNAFDRLLPFAIVTNTLTDVALAALAYRYNVGATVRARSVVEPWTQTLAAVGFLFVLPAGGLALSYILAKLCALVVALVPLFRSYGRPRLWKPNMQRLARLALTSAPLAGADMIEWGTRKLDIALLGFFTSPVAVGIYYAAQQVATLPQKLKTSFEPILGPVITRNLKERNYAAIAQQVCQVGYWITAAQAGIALALGIPGKGVMGLVGPQFVAGTGALALLLTAEVVAAPAVVSEAALIYMARMRNLYISLGAIALQGALTVALMLLARQAQAGPLQQAEAAAFALAVALALSSLVKSKLLARILGAKITNLRWPLVWAAAPAALVGFAVKLLPEWLELSLGIPAILGVYGFVIWRFGFGPEDRLLFRKQRAVE